MKLEFPQVSQCQDTFLRLSSKTTVFMHIHPLWNHATPATNHSNSLDQSMALDHWSQESHATLHWLDLTALVHIPQGKLKDPGFDSTSPERAVTCAFTS